MFKNKSLNHLIILQALILLACLLTSCFSSVSLKDDLVFFAVQLFIFFIPGLAVCLLCDIGLKRIQQLIAYSYMFGLAISIIIYFAAALIGIWMLDMVLYLMIISVCLYVIYRNFDRLSDLPGDDLSYSDIILTAFIILIDLFTVSMANPLTVKDAAVQYNKDFLFWIGNSISFLKGLPVNDFRLAGYGFYYHYFSNIIVCQMSLISGIAAVELSYCYSYIIVAVLLVYSTKEFLQSFVNNRYLIFAGMILILFSEGFSVFFASHIYFCPFGFDYSYALAMLGIAQLFQIYKEDDYSIKNMITSCILIMLVTGLKAPVGIVVLMAYGAVAFCLLFEKKWKKGLVSGFAWLSSFLFVFLVFIFDFSHTVVSTNDLMFLGPLGAFDNNIWAISILNDLINKYGFLDNGITRIIALVLYVIESNVGAMLLLIVGTISFIYMFIRQKKIDVINLSLIAVSLWAILLTVNTYQNGNSQAYFIMSAFPYAALSGLYAIGRNIGNNFRFKVILMVLILLFSITDIRRFVSDRIFSNVVNALGVRSGSKSYQSGVVFTQQDYDLALWLKNNTEEQDYIAQDCFDFGDINKQEVIGVFSERYIWNDGKYAYEGETDRRRKIVDRVFDGDGTAVEDLKKENVRYLIQTLSVNPGKPEADLEEVYRSDCYVVYKLD